MKTIQIMCKRMIAFMSVTAMMTMAMAELSSPKINGAAAGQGTPIDIATPPTLSVQSDGDAAVWVKFTYKGATWYKKMDTGTDGYAYKMPIMAAGDVSYTFEAGDTFDEYSTTNALTQLGPYMYTISETLSNARQPDMAKWSPNSAAAVALDSDWSGMDVKMEFGGILNLAAKSEQLSANKDPSIRTRAKMNIGKVWFKAQYKGDIGDVGYLVLEKSVNPDPGFNHTFVDMVEIPRTENWIQFCLDVQSDATAYYRLRHPSATSLNEILIKDIVFSAPTADVILDKSPVDFTPGYPSRYDDMTFKVKVVNVYANTPAENISPKLIWRFNKEPWNTTIMRPIGGDEYQADLPKQPAGLFEYYYKADFTGYSHTGDFYISVKEPMENLADYSLWLDKDERVSENLSPATYPDFENSHLYNLEKYPPVAINDGSELDYDKFKYLGFDIRRFRSKHETLTLEMSPAGSTTNLNIDAAYPMMQVGDYTWQAVIHLTNAVDVGATVVGRERYNDDGTAYDPRTYYWKNLDQTEEEINPPMAGYVVDTGAGNNKPLRIAIDYDGFMMFRFCSTNGQYQVRRAAWQDFNTWQANNTQFTRSFGLYETDVYESDLTGATPTDMNDALIVPFESSTDNLVDKFLNFSYVNGLVLSLSTLKDERTRFSYEGKTVFNRAVEVSADPNFRGSIQTTSTSETRGRDTLKMRVRVAMDDDNLAVYRHGYAFYNYTVTAKAKTSSISDGKPSISVYGYYNDLNNYLEGRLTQKVTAEGKKRLRLSIFQNKNGILTELSGTEWDENTLTLASQEWWLMFTFKNGGDEGGQATLQLGKGSTSAYKKIENKSFTLDFPSIKARGTVAVNSRDAKTEFKVSVSEQAAVAKSSTSDWSIPISRVTGAALWTSVNGTSEASPITLERIIPEVPYQVAVFRNGLDEAPALAPVPDGDNDWDYDWDVDGDDDAVRTVDTFAWQEVEVPMHFWDNVFIKVEPGAADANLMVDDLAVSAWRGETIYDPILGDTDTEAEYSWQVTYGVVSEYEHENMGFELARSRANPDDDQMIVTPLLNDGIGDLLFNYKVTQGNVSFMVDAIKENGTTFARLAETNVYATADTDTMFRMYAAALTNVTGRIRVTINNEESSDDGILIIDNLKATNYPDVGDTSWEAYNVMISSFDWNPEIKFDGAANPDYRSSVINNSFTNNTPLGVAYDTDLPYIQSPRIETGIGEVSFWYRAYPEEGKASGKIYLKAAKDVAAPLHEWVTFAVADLNPDSHTYAQQVVDLEGMTNVVATEWTYFNVEFYAADYKVFRIYSEVDGPASVMFDNIIVTEPVRSSIDIGAVRLIPDIPLFTDEVGLDVKLINPRMNPENIRVNLLYVTGEGTWGTQNWEQRATVVPLVQDPEDKYHYVVTNAIPQKPIDTVVQYAVKVEYTGTFPEPVYYGEQFENPEWYEPVNLNEKYADKGKSPYYYVFSVGTNSVFINEFLPYGYSSYYGNYAGLLEQYVELIGTDNAIIAGWTLEHLDVEKSWYEDTVMYTNTLKAGAKFVERLGEDDPTDKHWGFYTLACSKVNDDNSNFSNVHVDQELFPDSFFAYDSQNNEIFSESNSDEISMGVPGALCLKRSMGAYVQRIAWGTDDDIGEKGEGDKPGTGLVGRGYEALPNRGSGTSNYRKPYQWTDNNDQDNPGLGWMLVDKRLYSPGYYNSGQGDLIWATTPIDGAAPVIPPEVAVNVTAIQVDAAKATVSFDVKVTNSAALTSDSGFSWYIETSPDISFETPTQHAITGAITAVADGTPSTYDVDVSLTAPVPDALFYRVKVVTP